MKKLTLSITISVVLLAFNSKANEFTNLKSNLRANLSEAVEANGKLYFNGSTSAQGSELWLTDGTAHGTKLIKDIRPGTDNSNPTYLTEYNGKIYFSANDGSNGAELCVSDGTQAGTFLFRDINPLAGNSRPSYITKLKNSLLFRADNGTNGAELWSFNYIFLVNQNPIANIIMVKDINPGAPSSIPKDFIEYKNKLYFSARTANEGEELWVTDGTQAGTLMLKDINPNGHSFPANFTIANDLLFFSANDGIHGDELWVTDGTTAGTKMVSDINSNGNEGSRPRHLFSFNGKVYFNAVVDGNNFLGISDGENVTIRDFPGINPKNFTVLNNRLYFIGYENFLCNISGLTDNIIQKIKQIGISSTSDISDNLIEYNSKLYFRGYDATNGYQLWESDGTSEGTKVISPPIATKSNPLGHTDASTHPFEFRIYNNALYFSADYDSNQLSLWQLKTTPTSVRNTNIIEASIYPNPVKNHLYIQTEYDVKEVKLLSIAGKHLQTWNNQNIIDLSNYSNGMYLVQIQTENGNAVKKITIRE